MDIESITSNKKKFSIFVVLLAALIFVTLVGVWLWSYDRQNYQNKSPVRARVGTLVLTEKDIQYKLDVERAYGNQTLTHDVALQVLVQNAVEQEVARTFGVLPTQKDIDSFRDYASSTSKAPEILLAVKNVFGLDSASYNRIYLLPKIVNTTLHSFFSSSKDINKTELAGIEKAYTEVISGGSFKDIAKKNSLQYTVSTTSSRITDATFNKELYFSIKNFPDPRFLSVAKLLKPMEINKSIVEDSYAYSIVRLISVEKDAYIIEAIISKKRDYDAWYKKESGKIIVEFTD